MKGRRQGLKRITIALIGVAIAAGLFIALRPGGGSLKTTAETTPTTTRRETRPMETEPAPDALTTTAETAPAGTAPAETTPTTPKPEVATLRIIFENGRVVGGLQRLTVEKGARVRIVVRADIADHVHVHGYDIMRDVGPGRPAQIAFRATLAGRFETELEERKLLIAQLEVRP